MQLDIAPLTVLAALFAGVGGAVAFGRREVVAAVDRKQRWRSEVEREMYDEIVQALPNHRVPASRVAEQMRERGLIGRVEDTYPPHPGFVMQLALAYRRDLIDWPDVLVALGYIDEGAADGGASAPESTTEAAAEA